MSKHIGILTAGGDSPGLNAAIRGVAKAAINEYGMQVIGFRDGFRGLVDNRTVRLESGSLSGILTVGGTILGTSRDKPHKMKVGGKIQDMTNVIVENYHANQLDALVCLGGGGTQKNALRLKQRRFLRLLLLSLSARQLLKLNRTPRNLSTPRLPLFLCAQHLFR